MRPILILGLGNPLQGDDGVGCRVAQALEQVVSARSNREWNKAKPKGCNEAMIPWDEVEVMDGGTPGVGLLNFLEKRKRVIIVDAAEMGIAPGEFRRFAPQEIALTGSRERLSLHRSGVADALALARELHLQLPEIIFFGVQPMSIEWRDSLSLPVQAAVPRVIEAILNELKQ